MSTKKRTKILLCIAIVMLVVSMVGQYCVQTNWGYNSVKTYYVTLSELGDMIRANNEATGKNIEITFTEDSVSKFSFMTLIPDNASAENPVPAIVLAHGGNMAKELFQNAYVELARRGFVVISIDMAGHGWSDNAISDLTGGSYGMTAAVEYAMSLPCVDETQIGVSGQSMGNLASYSAVTQMNTEGSTQRIRSWIEGTGTMYAAFMTSESTEGLLWLINVAKYDEFDTMYFSSATIYDYEGAKNVVRLVYPELGEESIAGGRWYGTDGLLESPVEGTALDADSAICFTQMPIDHQAYTFSRSGTTLTIKGFYDAFGTPSGARYISSENHVWWLMVVFSVIGIFGFAALLFPTASLLLDTKVFAGVRRKKDINANLPSFRSPVEYVPYILTTIASLVVSYFTYIYTNTYSSVIMDSSIYVANTVHNGVALWTLYCV